MIFHVIVIFGQGLGLQLSQDVHFSSKTHSTEQYASLTTLLGNTLLSMERIKSSFCCIRSIQEENSIERLDVVFINQWKTFLSQSSQSIKFPLTHFQAYDYDKFSSFTFILQQTKGLKMRAKTKFATFILLVFLQTYKFQ